MVSEANEISFWNPGPVLKGELTLDCGRYASFVFEGEGFWIRGGNGTIQTLGEAPVLAVITTNNFPITISTQGGRFDGGGELHIPCASHLTLSVLAGYKYSAEAATLDFLQEPTVFRVREFSKGPYVGIKSVLKESKYSLMALYKFMIADMRAILRQEGTQEVNIRKAEGYGNFLAGGFSYILRNHCSIGTMVAYGNICNSKVGTSLVFQNDRLLSNTKSILRMQGSTVSISIFFDAEF